LEIFSNAQGMSEPSPGSYFLEAGGKGRAKWTPISWTFLKGMLGCLSCCARPGNQPALKALADVLLARTTFCKFTRRKNMADEVISNQNIILDNQATLLANQKTILDNQDAIKKNQSALNSILKNQELILKNQKEILAALKK
jgi:hypothetical protein